MSVPRCSEGTGKVTGSLPEEIDLIWAKEILKSDQYPSMKQAIELVREGLRINIANESRASGNRSTLLPVFRWRLHLTAQLVQNLTAQGTCTAAACLKGI